MTAAMTIAVVQEQGRVPVTVFEVAGDIDTSTYERLQTQAEAAYRDGMRYLLIDLTQVIYVSSAGLRALHRIAGLLRSADSTEGRPASPPGMFDGSFKSPHLKLLNPSSDIARALKLTGFDMMLDVYNDLPAAIASF